jgi:hypothetical protein
MYQPHPDFYAIHMVVLLVREKPALTMAVGSFSWQTPGFVLLRRWHAGCLEREYFDT